MKGVHHRHGVGQFLGGGGLEPGEPVHRDDLDPVTPGLLLVGQPRLEGLFRAALDHVQQPSRPGAVADAGEVDDHGDVLVAAAGVSPHVLIDPDDLHSVEPAGVLDQDTAAFGQDRVVRGVPRHPQPLGDAGHGEVLDHDGFQRPPQTTTRQLRPRLGRAAGVLAPHVPTTTASVAAHRHHQYRGTPAHRLVRQPPDHAVANGSFAATSPAPAISLVSVDDPAGKHRPIRCQTLAGDFEAELVKACERGQVRAGEGSVRHVEVFQMRCVGTYIFGRPQPLPRQRRAAAPHTLNCEEPVSWHATVPFTFRIQVSHRTQRYTSNLSPLHGECSQSASWRRYSSRSA